MLLDSWKLLEGTALERVCNCARWLVEYRNGNYSGAIRGIDNDARGGQENGSWRRGIYREVSCDECNVHEAVEWIKLETRVRGASPAGGGLLLAEWSLELIVHILKLGWMNI